MLTIVTVEPGAREADGIVRAYMSDVASRYYGRPATSDEVQQAMLDEPYDDLAGASGTFVIASEDGHAIACAGARFGQGVADLTKVFTLPEFRGRGVGTLLLGHLELACRERGLRVLRLDTRSDLTEACALYERLGFARVEAFNQEPYSDRWYAKALTGSALP
ncbi:MAG: GNAT family N-acetyltransferase [Cellulomonadaceae bacterium]|nr:GNAT family N-acetyltransferase [Cellulomonadaceae bacterium]